MHKPMKAPVQSDVTHERGLFITKIETIPIVAPLAREFKGSYYSMAQRATLIIQLHTSEGIMGEAYVGDELAGLHEINRIVTNEIAPRLIGMDAMRTAQCWEAAYPATYDILRDRRLGLVALAATDTAIWDAVGKAVGQPLWKLWGGYTNKVAMIAIGGYYGEPLGTIADEIASYKSMGLGGMKFKIGGATPEVDSERVRAAFAAAGSDFVIAVDANQGYTVQDAIEFGRRTSDLDIMWFEEPVRWHNDRRSMAAVRQATPHPVCAGQSEFSPSGCRDLMEEASIDVCNFDASWSGGPTAWLRTAAIAHSYDTKMGHHEEPQVSSHLIASQSHGTVIECFHPDRDPFWWNMIANRPQLDNGYLTLSDAPGLGWELNWDYIDQYRVTED
jgi:L-alanine-DL-glutamate epimerase-like enolase superfamily enzyme